MRLSIILKKIMCRLSTKYRGECIKKEMHSIGKNCLICTFSIDQPMLCSLGDNVTLASECMLLNHDYSVQVLRNLYSNDMLDKVGSITIGNNVFIGARSIVLPNAIIKDNCIFSAGSVITGKTYESGYV